MLYVLRFFSLQNAVCFIMLIFWFCIIHILYTGCAETKKNNSDARGLIYPIVDVRLMYPSSGACDCVVELPHRSSCSVKTGD